MIDLVTADRQAIREWTDSDSERDAGLSDNPKGLMQIDNILYGPDKRVNRLDIYRPTKLKNRTLPVIIDMHGGAFIYGSRARYQYYCLHLAQAGYAVINYDYHLAPKYPFPYAWRDTERVLRWCADHAKHYHLDPKRVFLVGDSAGANLVEQYLTLCTNPVAAAKFHFKKPNLHIIAGAMNCGVYFNDKVPGKLNLMDSYYTQHAYQTSRDFIHIDQYIRRPFKPVFVMTANHDKMRDQNVRMDQLLIDRGIPHCFKIYGNAQQPREHVFQLNQHDPLAEACYRDETNFFEQQLKK